MSYLLTVQEQPSYLLTVQACVRPLPEAAVLLVDGAGLSGHCRELPSFSFSRASLNALK